MSIEPTKLELEKVFILQKQNKHKDASTLAATLLESYPLSTVLMNLAGISYGRIGLYSKAIAEFTKITEINVQNHEAYNNLGVMYKNNGDLATAIKCYKVAIKLDSKYVNAHYNLGVALMAQGNALESIEAYNNAIAINKSHIKSHFNKGLGLSEMGKLDDAIVSYENVLKEDKDNLSALNNLGNLMRSKGKITEAIKYFSRAELIDGNHFELKFNFAVTLLQDKQLTLSISKLRQAIKLDLKHVPARVYLGHAFLQQKKFDKAKETYESVVSIAPDNAEALNGLGCIYRSLNSSKKALNYFSKAAFAEPKHIASLSNLAAILWETGEVLKAKSINDKALRIDPEYPDALNNHANFLQDSGNLNKAIEVYDRILTLNTAFAKASVNKGNALKALGRISEARHAYENTLKICPSLAEANRAITEIKDYQPNDPHIERVLKLLQQKNLPLKDRAELNYAYAKMSEDIGNFHEAFNHYSLGGSLMAKFFAYNIEKDAKLFAQIKRNLINIFSFERFDDNFRAQVQPIFILGMPRSGTTLVEQIISSHSAVNAGGELRFIAQFFSNISYGNCQLTSENVNEARMKYLTKLKEFSNDLKYVTDKMPHNFLHVGIILKAFPEAKVVHVVRDPFATCWSNFKHFFPNNGLGYSFKLEDTVRYYNMYQELMSKYKLQFKDRIYTCHYEKIVSDKEVEIENLFSYLNLHLENACLLPHKNQSVIKTASALQARKEIYSGSNFSWQKFKLYTANSFKMLK